MTPRRVAAERISGNLAELGEGPTWDADRELLLWVDIPGQQVLMTDPTTGLTTSRPTPSQVGAIALNTFGELVAALEDGLYLDDNGKWIQLAEVEATDPTTRMNDGKCDPAGAFVGGTMARDGRRGTASLYRIESSGNVTRLLGGLTISNGIEWTRDGRTMYHIDTPTRTVMAYDYDVEATTLHKPRPIVELPLDCGMPDGMTLDSTGCLWVALWEGGAVHRFTPDGILDTIVELPVSRVTSCTFGGPDLDTLFITTAAPDLNMLGKTQEPEAGALFAVSVGVSGQAPTRFRTSPEYP